MSLQEPANGRHEPLMTETEMASYLRIKPRQLFNWRADGLIPYMKIGRSVRYRKSAVDSALEKLTSALGAAA